jgi:transcriptional regulator with XRE-family HTH domain
MAYRKSAEVLQEEIALALGIDQTHFSRIERGLQTPSPQLAKRIAEYFGNAVTRDQILFPEEYPVDVTKKKPAAKIPGGYARS